MQNILDLFPDGKITLKPAEAAKLINVSLPTLYALINSETSNFPAIRIGNTGRSIIIPTLSLLKWLDEQAGGNGELSFLPECYRLVSSGDHSGNFGGYDD